MPKNLIEKSLARERLDAAYCNAIRPEITEYIRRISSARHEPETALPEKLFMIIWPEIQFSPALTP